MIGVTLVLLLLLGFAAAELFWPKQLREGFETLIPALNPKAGYFNNFVPRRGDVAPGLEESGYIQDKRYFQGYVDVQRLGVDNDFCRMIYPLGQEQNKFLACALAGTENLTSTSFKTPKQANGFQISRDDYMRDINKDGRADYCRILKAKDGSWQPQCNRSMDLDFDPIMVTDVNPPADIASLLRMYDGCLFWYRFRDDMLDYVKNTKISVAGGAMVDETPYADKPISEALKFNGIDQFLRIGDGPDLELGTVVPLRSMRAIMVWVYFDEFTNNAHILDFGEGAGYNNIVLGIVGRGDGSITDAGSIRPPLLCGSAEGGSTLPTEPSGAQPVPIMTPQELMFTTAANVNDYSSIGFEGTPRRLPPSRIQDKVLPGPKNKATLLFEIWDQQQRKMRIRVPSVVPKEKWTHICITSKTEDAFRPDIGIYIDGKQVYLESSGYLPQAGTLSNCYIGKSNWASATKQFENRDELFKGRLFDLRAYKVSISDAVLKESIAWGRKCLGLQ
jgi:hypothetical protein